ncbi:uncharacterized protein [Parasteatoda tepidariorum]|uniref:uncharacterized protein n=1 Tax=Parasteatoda tepidariorum TaxID=114398 RepID=UPI001C7216D0|nr:uncharacterized protein LOC107451244 [Parasteatoda tepidariorum]
MKKRQCCFIINLILTCSVLYVIHSYLNSLYTWKCCKFLFGSEKSVGIPSIVVYSNKNNIKESTKCQNFNHTLIISTIKNEWQKIDHTNLYVYSAYIDDRIKGKRFIRIIAMSKGMFRQRIFCNTWTNNENVYSYQLDFQELWITSWDMATPDQYYRPFLLSCEVDKTISPSAITVTTTPCKHSSSILLLNKTHSKSRIQRDFMVCLKPLNFKYDITVKLLEWLELQFLLGADKVAVYVYKVPFKVLNVLKHYEEQGKVTIKYISLLDSQEVANEKSEQNVWQKRRYEMAIYNDCFYNHILTHKVVVNLDLDEAIIPIKASSWPVLFKQAKKYSPNIFQFASISAPNVYFFDSFGEESDESVPEYSYMLRHLIRSSNFTPPGFAQKSFFLTNNTLSVTNHYALKSLHYSIRTNTAMKKELAQLNHYRSACPSKMEIECLENYMKFTVKDPIILKYKDTLSAQIKKRLAELNLTA